MQFIEEKQGLEERLQEDRKVEIQKQQQQVCDFSELVITDEFIIQQKKLGQGKTSLVYKIQEPSSGRIFAIKKFKDHLTHQHDIKNEIRAFEAMEHENVVKMLETDKKDNSYIIIEYMQNGELFDYVLEASKKFPRALSRFYFKQLVNAVEHMHSKNLCHRDLKLENCLLDGDFNLKLTDFGFSCKNEVGTYDMDRILGTDGYMAPEMCLYKQYDGFETDVFALGVILFILYSGFPPFYKKAIKTDPYYKFFANNKQQQYWKNLESKFGLKYEDSFKDLINQMLECDPLKRIKLDDVISHSFFEQDIMGEEERISYMENLKQKLQN